MSELRILLVEDEERDLERCRRDLKNYNEDKQREIELVECETLDDVLEELETPFDGVIIDLELTPGGDEGKQVIRQIRESLFRIPIFIFTGKPEAVDKSIKGIEVFTKSNTNFSDLLDELCETYNTGFTRILGGDGKIEELLGKVFLDNLLQQRKKWVSYGKTDLKRAENALLRYTLNHLLQLLDEDGKPHFQEEFYLYPHVSKDITTGSIVREKTSNQRFVILTPACDLVIRNGGEFKADRILLAEIEIEADIVNDALDGISRKRSKKNKLKAIFNNNDQDYYHWLPETDFFNGGFLNFRKLKMLEKDDFEDQFEEPSIQISPFFIKDIVSRFSAYYARQGQPDIDSKAVFDCYMQQQDQG